MLYINCNIFFIILAPNPIFSLNFLLLSVGMNSFTWHLRSIAFARSLTAGGSVRYRELLLAQAAELLLWPKSGKCPLSTLRMADMQISASLSPCPPPWPNWTKWYSTMFCITFTIIHRNYFKHYLCIYTGGNTTVVQVNWAKVLYIEARIQIRRERLNHETRRHWT